MPQSSQHLRSGSRTVLRNESMHQRLIPLLVASCAATLLAIGCESGVQVDIDPSHGDDHHSEPSAREHRGNGPPDHAPAHGYRRKYEYQYYADSNVYHDRERGMWFWIEGDGWEVGVELPDHVYVGDEAPMTIELEHSTPALADEDDRHPGRGRGRDR